MSPQSFQDRSFLQLVSLHPANSASFTYVPTLSFVEAQTKGRTTFGWADDSVSGGIL